MRQIRENEERAMRQMGQGAAPDSALNQWIARLEMPAKTRSAATHARPDAAATTSTARPGDTPSADPPGGMPAHVAKVRDAIATIELRGSSVTFSDAVGGVVVLGRSGDRVSHGGTVAVRGPYGLALGALRRHGLTEPQARGFEFVASWFGVPFDAVAVNRSEGGRSLTWGFWPLGGADIGRALSLWKGRSPASFAEMLETYGVDVAPAAEQDLGGPDILLVDPVKGSLLRGDRALDGIARDPRRLALLARAGRHDDAKAAQLEVALRPFAPLLRMSVRRGDERIAVSAIAGSPRAVAALVLVSRAVDLARMAEILGSVALDATDDESKLIAMLIEAVAPRSPSTALAVRRAVSSPEVGA